MAGRRFGHHGAYLRIDLDTGDSRRIEIEEADVSRFVGGVGLGAWIALREGGAELDPLDPASPLVYALSPLVGTPLTTSAKFAVVGRSPLTGFLSDAISSSHFAIAAKRTGYDAFLIRGRARELSRLVVDDGRVSVVPAPELKGRSAADCGLEGFKTSAIGPAGENGVRFATISNDGRHAGRGGLGALLGAKNLKAFSVRGQRQVELFDPRGVVDEARRLSRLSFGPATAKYRELGTIANLLVLNRFGALPTRNFLEGHFDGAPGLSAEALHEFHKVGRESCAACTIGCEHVYGVRGSTGGVRLEYETLFALGSLLGIQDRDAVLSAAELCDRLGLDTISTGGTLAFAMEAGVGGLAFGDAEGARAMISRIALRDGVGNDLAEGSRRAAEAVGRAELAMHVKGLEIPGYDPRAMPAMALGFAVGTRGADHNRSGAYELDFSGEIDRDRFDEAHAARVVEVEDRTAAIDSLILCKFLRGVFADFEAEGSELLRLVTGLEVDLRRLGARVCSLRKLFNIRAGWLPEDDRLPGRLLEGRLSREKLAAMIATYYRARGWTDDGAVPPETAARLGLGDLLCRPSP